jgi:hypothetical protein
MHKMQKIQKRREFNGLADTGRPAKNMQKMQKFTSEATAVHALSGNALCLRVTAWRQSRA